MRKLFHRPRRQDRAPEGQDAQEASEDYQRSAREKEETNPGYDSTTPPPSSSTQYEDPGPGHDLREAIQQGDWDGAAAVLRAVPHCVNHTDTAGNTALHYAAAQGQDSFVERLLQSGASVNARSKRGRAPLSSAVCAGKPSTVMVLLKAGANINEKSNRGYSLLFDAVQRSGCAPLLVCMGASINNEPADGLMVLHTAVRRGRYEDVLILCACGANPSALDDDGYDAFSHAAMLEPASKRRGMLDMLRRCDIRRKYTPSLRQESLRQFVKEEGEIDFNSMLWVASKKGDMALLEYLFDLHSSAQAALVELHDSAGLQAIHHAARGGEARAVEFLLDRGARIDSLTAKDGWTPLLLAAEKGRKRTVSTLLSHGADILAKTPRGESVFQVALKGHHEGTMQRLVAAAEDIQDSSRRSLALEELARAQEPQNATLESSVTTPNAPAKQHESETESGEIETSINTTAGTAHSSGTIMGSFDGLLYSVPAAGSIISQSRTFDQLIHTTKECLEFKERDRRCKVAVLDTGFDLENQEWHKPRALRFSNGDPMRDDREPAQGSRIKGWKDFTALPESQSGLTDLDGHGTQVAGLVLRLAPRAELYIARICEGSEGRGTSRGAMEESEGHRIRHPQPEIVAQAINWAVEQEVDLINMSFGFLYPQRIVKEAIKNAQAKGILVFAAMSNDGNNSPGGPAWPARDPSLVIGVHSCREGGRKTSDFTPPHVPHSHNFMVVGENVVTHWPLAKGGGFRLDDGTSFATPVATAIAALLLAFVWQGMCKKEREAAKTFINLDELHQIDGMRKVLSHISNEGENEKFSYIHPALFWKGFNPTGIDDTALKRAQREHAWNLIREALS